MLNQIFNFIFQIVNKVIHIPFCLERVDEISEATYLTFKMLIVSGFFSLLFGIIFGVTLVVTKKEGILENKVIYFLVDKVINFFRSVPFVILIGLLLVVTRFISGSAIGVEGTYVPLVFGTTPFFSRQIESSLEEVDGGLIEASIAMGLSPIQIIFSVYLKESVPSIIRGTSITFISLIGLTAMAGQVGGGGLGNFAIRYGYQRGIYEATWVSIIIILIIVTVIQSISNLIIRKTTH